MAAPLSCKYSQQGLEMEEASTTVAKLPFMRHDSHVTWSPHSHVSANCMHVAEHVHCTCMHAVCFSTRGSSDVSHSHVACSQALQDLYRHYAVAADDLQHPVHSC